LYHQYGGVDAHQEQVGSATNAKAVAAEGLEVTCQPNFVASAEDSHDLFIGAKELASVS